MKYSDLVRIYSELEKTSKRLEKTFIISEFIKKLDFGLGKDDLRMYFLLIQGKIFSDSEKKEIGISNKLLIKALISCFGSSEKEIESLWKEFGDLGVVAEHLTKYRKQQTLFSAELSVKKVFSNLRKIASVEGAKSVDIKLRLISELLNSADPVSVKYLVRNILEDLRIGVATSSLRDAIVWAFLYTKVNYDPMTKTINPDNREEYSAVVDKIQYAIDKINDITEIAIVAKTKGLKGLESIKVKIGIPIKVMLAQKVKSFDEAFEVVGFPCQVEFKYDGFRMQIHKDKNNVTLFTRRLENVTAQFPDVVEAVKSNVMCDKCILDSEVVGYDVKTGKYLPFQFISQRIKRKYDIIGVSKSYPVEVNVFDIIFYEDKEFLNEPFETRRKLIEKIIRNETHKIVCAESILLKNKSFVEDFFKNSLNKGNEGIMFKNLDAPYKPGSRVGFMVKLKPVMDTLDLVITGAEWGTGKRKGWLTSFILSCFNPETNEFLEIGKVGTGIKELESDSGITFSKLTELLKPLIIKEEGKLVEVVPKLVVEIEYEEIQQSHTYSSGYALRFPRLKALRNDRLPEDCSDIFVVENLFYKQNKRNNKI